MIQTSHGVLHNTSGRKGLTTLVSNNKCPLFFVCASVSQIKWDTWLLQLKTWPADLPAPVSHTSNHLVHTHTHAAWTHTKMYALMHMHQQIFSVREGRGSCCVLELPGLKESIWPQNPKDAVIWPHRCFWFPKFLTPSSHCTCRTPIDPLPRPFHHWEHMAMLLGPAWLITTGLKSPPNTTVGQGF